MSPDFLVMIGAFPPPVGGAAKNNELLYQSLIEAGVVVTKFDTAAKNHQLHHRSLSFHARRIALNLEALFGARRWASENGILYIVPDGGLGVFYTSAQMRFASRRFGRVVLHHRTFRYIDAYSSAMAAIVATCPERTTHVFLSQGMKDKFEACYGQVSYRIASNARFVESEAIVDAPARAPHRSRIGHLSNLCREKGFFDVADSFDAVRKTGCDAELVLAGPVIEPEVSVRLARLIEDHPGAVTHVGAVSGEVKRSFYRNLDLFLFPTRFDQEAAPNVVYEALAAGVPVIATPRGCIAEMLADIAESRCVKHSDFAEAVVASILQISSSDGQPARANAIKANIRAQCAQSRRQYAELMELLGAGTGAEIGQEFFGHDRVAAQ